MTKPTNQAGVDIFEPSRVDIFEPSTAPTSPTVADIGIDTNLRYRRRATKRDFIHALHVANAAEHLERLPEPGETTHAIMKGNFNAWDLVPATLRLAEPATIATLYVATLSFNRRNTDELVHLIDAGQIGAVAFIASIYFRAKNAAEWEHLRDELTRRGCRCLAPRNHAKVIAMHLSDGRPIVIESSANLRSCRNVEQFAMTHDEDLYRFHAGWMETLLNQEADR